MPKQRVRWTLLEAVEALLPSHERAEFRRLNDRFGGPFFFSLDGCPMPGDAERQRYWDLREPRVAELLTSLRSSEFESSRFDADRGPLPIHAQAWELFEPDIAYSTASGEGIKYVGVRVWPVNPTWASARAENECRAWLVELVEQGYVPTSKDDLWREAERRFPGLSRRGFDRCWHELRPTEWEKAGRRPRSKASSGQD